ncbi:RNase MRP subunit [Fusarium equiseti]|uniref:RNase MRP subunit n=1 Tax=Fusarium equiseti TaxID=61235 RepID=A0ABQ8REU8_FUSEQ|nr:RNase MRP subunit [Fusarium equiseti]
MTTPPDTALLASTSQSLAPNLTILNAFAHRHKNQHSCTHWWSSFSILRRASQKLSQDLISRPKKTKSHNAKRDNHPALVRAKWMMRHVIPSAFFTLSQLAADNQHAPLGLLLLSVLARINTLLSHLVPPEHDHNYESVSTTVVKSASAGPGELGSLNSTTQTTATEAPGSETDMGVAVSREELLSSQKNTNKPKSKSDVPQKGHKKELKHKTVHKSIPETVLKDGAKDKPKKKKKKGGDAFSSLFGSL